MHFQLYYFKSYNWTQRSRTTVLVFSYHYLSQQSQRNQSEL